VRDAPTPEPTDLAGTLSGIAHALANGDDLDQTLRMLVDAALRLTGADVGAVFVQNPDRVGMEPALGIGLDGDTWSRISGHLGRDGDPIARTARDRAPTRLGPGNAADAHGFLDLAGVVRAALEPLVVTRGGIQETLGVLALGWRGTTRTDDEDRLIGALARLIGTAVDHARLASLVVERSEWFERIARSDPLTGLANERAFTGILELELARAGRQGSQVSVALFDVDGFVAINERGGHEAGDDVLRAVAAVVSGAVRLVDTVARVGGDEFVVLAPGPAGFTVAQRVIEGIADLRDASGGRMSVSAGVARFPADGANADEVMAAAAAALAEAKGRGPASLHEASGHLTQ